MFAEYDLKDLINKGMCKLPCEKLLEGFESGSSLPYDFSAASFFVATEDGVEKLCHYCCGDRSDAFVLSYKLPICIAQLDSEAKVTSEFVRRNVEALGPAPTLKQLYRLSRLGTAWDDTTPQWENIARPILKAANRTLSGGDLTSLYADFLPRFSGDSWNVGEIPPRVISARDAARKLWLSVEDNPTDDLYGYRKWRLSCAEDAYNRAKAYAEEERYGRAR